MLGEALTSFDQERGYLPRVIVSHMNPPWEHDIREERQVRAIILSHRHFDHVRDLPPLGFAIRDTGVQILVSHADMTVQL